MTKHVWSRTAVLLIAMCLSPAVLRAAKKPVELRWPELAAVAQAHQVAVTLTGGGVVRGEAITFRDDALVMDVRSVRDTKQYSKGNAVIPRTEVAALEVQRSRGAWGRGLGTTLGIIGGMILGAYIGVNSDMEGGEALGVFWGVTAGAGVGGYFLGRELDRRVTRIVIVP